MGVIAICNNLPTTPAGDTEILAAVLPQSTTQPGIVHFSGGGLPSQLSVNGVQCQIDGLELDPATDGIRVFRGFALLPAGTTFDVPKTSGALTATESAPGAPASPVVPFASMPDAALLTFTLSPFGSPTPYIASIATALNTHVLIGPGNEKGHFGADYYRHTRYFCPFKSTNAAHVGTSLEFCGAMIVHLIQRVDTDGYIMEAMYANSHHVGGDTYDGDIPQNPGWVKYGSITLNKGAIGTQYQLRHADTFVGAGQPGAGSGVVGKGPSPSALVPAESDGKLHLSAPGTMPGWMFAIYDTTKHNAARIDAIMQVLDALVAFPAIVLYLVIITAFEQGDVVVVFAITVTGTPGIARLVRSLALDIKTRDYIRAAETRGESASWIMFREILPNARGPVLVDAMLRVGYAIFAIGTLGFLGIGLPPPDPDWGSMVNDARRFIFVFPWGVIPPSVAIASLVIGLNLFADGMREEITRYQK